MKQLSACLLAGCLIVLQMIPVFAEQSNAVDTNTQETNRLDDNAQNSIDYQLREDGSIKATITTITDDPETTLAWEETLSQEATLAPKKVTSQDETITGNQPEDAVIQHYQLSEQEVEREIISEQQLTESIDLSETVVYDQLDEPVVPETYEIEHLDQSYTLLLSDVSYTELEVTDDSITISGSTNYGFLLSQPTAPQTKEIGYTDRSGSAQTTTASFTGMTTGRQTWQSGVRLQARFVGDDDVKYFLLGSLKLPNTGETVPTSGYEAEILQHLGVSSRQMRIDRAAWNGASVQENGNNVRYATLYCSQLGRTYTANYQTEVLQTKVQYVATAEYALQDVEIPTGETQYLISVSAIYEPVLESVEEDSSFPVKLVVAISIALIILLLLAVAILFLIRKKKQQAKALPGKEVTR